MPDGQPLRKLRILHVTPYYTDAWAYGGIPRVAHALTHELARRGHDVTVCTTDVCDADSRLPRCESLRTDDGVSVRVFRNVSNRVAYHLQIYSPLRLRHYMAAHAHTFDVAHLHACRNLPGVIAAGHLRRAGVPYVLAPNGTAPRIERRRLAKSLFDALAGQRMFAGARRLLAVTDAEQTQLRQLGAPPSKIRIVPNPIDLQEFEPLPHRGAFRQRLQLGNGPIVLFMGKLTPRKRLDVLVRAFYGLDDPDARLVIAGNDMGAGARTRALVRELGLDTRTIFTGLLRARDRLEALADADVLIYPSQHEIFGLVALEAMLCGTPVVVADDSGCGEIVRRLGGGAVIPVGDVNACAAAMAAALTAGTAARANASRAAERIRAMYDAGSVCARLEDVYRELVTPR